MGSAPTIPFTINCMPAPSQILNDPQPTMQESSTSPRGQASSIKNALEWLKPTTRGEGSTGDSWGKQGPFLVLQQNGCSAYHQYNLRVRASRAQIASPAALWQKAAASAAARHLPVQLWRAWQARQPAPGGTPAAPWGKACQSSPSAQRSEECQCWSSLLSLPGECSSSLPAFPRASLRCCSAL